jgi:hypothetical protein
MPGEPPSGDTPPENTGRKPDGTFAPGNRANPRGKPKGARSRATAMLDAIMAKNVPDIAKKLIEAAKNGQPWAVQLALKDQMPGRITPFELPKIDTVADVPNATKAVLEEIAAGRLTAAEGTQIIGALETHSKILMTDEYEERFARIEEQIAAAAKAKQEGNGT